MQDTAKGDLFGVDLPGALVTILTGGERAGRAGERAYTAADTACGARSQVERRVGVLTVNCRKARKFPTLYFLT